MPRFRLEHTSRSGEETFHLGAELGRRLVRAGAAGPPFLALALLGDLGSGKTTFTKGIAAGLGVEDPDRVTSPTFVLRQEHRGAIPLLHYDVYRLSGAAELLALGFEEDLERGGLVVVEWADRVAEALPPEALTVELEHLAPLVTEREPGISGTAADAGLRRITFRGEEASWRALLPGPLR